MKGFLTGVLVTVILFAGGLWYRDVSEHPNQPIACPMDAKICPDGTTVSHEGLSCTFPTCPPPNIQLSDIGVIFALPAGFASATLPDIASVAAYEMPISSSTNYNNITIRRYMIEASSTALATIQQTAIGGASGMPVSATSFTSTILGTHRFTVVSIERFEGVVDIAYYLARGSDVLRFDAIDRDVMNWADPSTDISLLPTQLALQKMLATLQGE